MIPKVIMQTWKTKELPDKWKPTQTSIKKYMHGWNYVLMTDEMNRDFIKEHFPDFLETFDKFPYNIQRADAVRYAWLYINGGFYLDCDFELLGNLDEVFTGEHDLYLLSSSNVSSVITNGLIAARPRHPVFLEMIEEMKKDPSFYSVNRHLLVMNTTGPMAFTRVVKRLKPEYKKLDGNKLNPYTICDTVYNKEGALLKPLEGSSWVGPTSVCYRWFYCNRRALVGFVLVLLLILFAVFFTVRNGS